MAGNEVACACGTKFFAGAKHAGKTTKCPSCGLMVFVPSQVAESGFSGFKRRSRDEHGNLTELGRKAYSYFGKAAPEPAAAAPASSPEDRVIDNGDGTCIIDGKHYTLQGGDAEMIKRAMANGTFSGFRKAREVVDPSVAKQALDGYDPGYPPYKPPIANEPKPKGGRPERN